MKANELMIGDWVECVDSTHKKKVYAQIDAIEEGQTCILVRLDNCNWFLNISFIKPIPLTTQILEKNGFVIDDEWYIYTGQGVNIDVAFRDDNKFVYDLSILTGSGSMDIHAKYVHELQHALRLCGITHEIIL